MTPEFVEIAINSAVLRKTLALSKPIEQLEDEPSLLIKVPVRIKKSGRSGKMLISPTDLSETQPCVHAGMVKMIGRAHKWNKEFCAGKSMSEIAIDEKVHRSYVGQVLPLAFLAPDITEAILDGRQPRDLKVEQLLKPLPIEWIAQRQVLGFSNP